MSKYHHTPNQAWQTGVRIQCRYGLSGVILFIFLIILNIWIYFKSLFADLRFASIYLWQNKRIGEDGPPLMRHISKRFFSKIEELRNYVKKRTDIGTMPWIRKKIKIGLYYGKNCFNDIIYKIALCNRSFMHYNKATHKLCFLVKSTESYRIGSHKIERIM